MPNIDRATSPPPEPAQRPLSPALLPWLKTWLKTLWEWRGIWITTPLVAGMILGFRALGGLQLFEWMAYDQFVQLRPARPIDPRIVIIGIDEIDLQTLGHYPIDDATLAHLLTQVKAQQPRVIGLDIFRDFPIAPGSAQLQQILRTTPNLIGIEKRQGNRDRAGINPANSLKQLGQTAANNVILDADGKLRRGLLYWTDGAANLESIGLRLALEVLASQGIEPQDRPDGILALGKATFYPWESHDGSYIGADAGAYQVLLNYRGPAQSFRTVSLTQVIQGPIPPDLFRDRIVLIGVTADSLHDNFYTPYSGNTITTPEKTAGVEIIATITSQVLQAAQTGHASLRFWSEPQEWGWIILWSGIGAGLGWWIRTPRWAIASIIGLGGGLSIGSYGAFLGGWWIPVVPPVLALSVSTIVLTGYVANVERRDRAAVMNLFGRYVTPTIAAAIWRDREQLFRQGRLKGRKMPVTVLFTDLKDFSTIAERTDPEILMEWLNEYMEAMTEVVLAHGGVVDKFIGDAIMALFGVPIARDTPDLVQADAQSAVDCAIGMAQALAKLNAQWHQLGRPTLQMRVGICTGTVVTGTLGGQQRMEYTAIGDTVNIAARLESYDKSITGGICRILVSDTTYDRLDQDRLDQTPGKSPPIRATAIGSVQLKGREQATQVYQILYDLPDDNIA
jgi:adenylate cyclase